MRPMAMKFELQEHLGKYPIVREIGSGATSRVYLARDPFADRDVAIKVFLFADNVNPQTERMMHKAFLADRKSTRLNSSHANISYAVFCLKKKKKNEKNL